MATTTPMTIRVQANGGKFLADGPPAPVSFTLLHDPSIFHGTFDMKVPGFYQAAITAVQKSTGKLGTGTVTFFTKP